MDATGLWWGLVGVTFAAATVQAATGFGFGLIAVGAFLLLLDSLAAIQVVIIVTFAMACVQGPLLRRAVWGKGLIWLALGALPGFILGIGLYRTLDVAAVKTVVAAVIIAVTLHNAWREVRFGGAVLSLRDPRTPLAGVGVAAGAMASALAMPGPPVMLYLSATALDKHTIRATVLAFFVLAYGGALACQVVLVGVALETWLTALWLTPPALLGLLAGHGLAPHIPQPLFKVLVWSILLLTGLAMLLSP